MTPTSNPQKLGAWLTTENIAAVEMISSLGYDYVVLDVEHGAFDLATLMRFVPFIKAKGLFCFVKVIAPDQASIQQALDMGANGVIIPHIRGLEHARSVCQYSKFAPVGDRSFAGGHVSEYGGFTDEWLVAQNTNTLCFPMVEDRGALEDIKEILTLDTVDGVFVGTSDLSLSRGRGGYSRTDADFADIRTVAQAAKTHGKPWMLPSWSDQEKSLANELKIPYVLVGMEHSALLLGLEAQRNAFFEAAASAGGAAA